MTPLKTRIMLADDHAVVRHGLRLLLDSQPDLEVVAEASDGADAVRRTLAGEVDLAIVDVTMPLMTGLQAIRELHRRRPQLRSLVLSMHENEHYLDEAMDAGASGYVLKTAADRELIDACRAVMRGEPFLCPATMTTPARNGRRSAGGSAERSGEVLSPREQQVLKLIAEGFSSRQIASILTISEKTVERHRANVLTKLDMHDRVELTRYAIRRGLVEP